MGMKKAYLENFVVLGTRNVPAVNQNLLLTKVNKKKIPSPN